MAAAAFCELMDFDEQENSPHELEENDVSNWPAYAATVACTEPQKGPPRQHVVRGMG
jgi:hypothetical protein